MDSIDRSSWRFDSWAGGDVDAQLDTLDLRCLVCTEGFSAPVSLRCGHVFCASCLAAWREHSDSCPVDRRRLDGEVAKHEAEIDATLACLRVVCTASDCAFDGRKSDHTRCPLLKCSFKDCNHFCADLTALFLHRKKCEKRDSFCAECFGDLQDENRETVQEHRKSCSFETPLIDWSPTLKFGMSPAKVFREVHRFALNANFRHLPEQDQPSIVYSAMQTAQEITSFDCRYFFAPYRHCMHLFHPNLNLPNSTFTSSTSYVCFLFQLNMGLRLVSIRLYPLHYQLVDRLGSCLDAFLDTHSIPKTEPISFSIRRPECLVAIGASAEEGGELNIEFVDSRFPAKGGFRAHAQLDDFVSFS
ncbi:hypothetical protein BDR26DRAFT_887202 [Obelidium mucronatum]|nr:hypothetical protein BDR26DRAFT_887202 [Obelidium mucronatum]